MNRLPTLDGLFAIGNAQREQNYSAGVPKEGVDYMTETWVNGLVAYADLHPSVAKALLNRWLIYK